MDKEVQKIKSVCAITGDLMHIDFLQAKQGAAWKIALLIYELGYRKHKNICPKCGMDIDVYREVLPDGGKTCEEIENET